MTTLQLKENLIARISKIKDKKKLFAIQEYVEMKCDTFHENGAVRLTPEMIQLLEISEQEYLNGNFTEHGVLMDNLAKKYGW